MPIKFMCVTFNQTVHSLETDFIPGMRQPVAGAHLVYQNYFCVDICICVCISPLRLLVISGVMWHNMDPVSLVKQVL